MRNPLAIAIMGPTASGKTNVAELLATHLHNPILISADAFLVYKRLDIGTAKPKNKHLYELIDILDPCETFSVGQFLNLAKPICISAQESNRDVIVVGGTGLYIRALFDEYQEISPPADKAFREYLISRLKQVGNKELIKEQGLSIQEIPEQILMNPVHLIRFIERKKITAPAKQAFDWKVNKKKFCLDMPVDLLNKRISQRVDNMFDMGWIHEVSELVNLGASEKWQSMKAIGYLEIMEAIKKNLDLESVKLQIMVKSRQYAKRQRTWLRKEQNITHVKTEGNTSKVVEFIMSCL
jgi:tRNA dimethylallyltransferase